MLRPKNTRLSTGLHGVSVEGNRQRRGSRSSRQQWGLMRGGRGGLTWCSLKVRGLRRLRSRSKSSRKETTHSIGNRTKRGQRRGMGQRDRTIHRTRNRGKHHNHRTRWTHAGTCRHDRDSRRRNNARTLRRGHSDTQQVTSNNSAEVTVQVSCIMALGSKREVGDLCWNQSN